MNANRTCGQIDILLGTYNGRKYLPDLIESILGQSYKDFRLLVSDDCSTDDTLHVLERYAAEDCRIRIVSEKQRYGSAKANFIALLSESTAPYIAFADQDDVWERDKLAVLITEIKRIENSGSGMVPSMVYSDLSVVDQNLKAIAPSYYAYMRIDPSRTRANQILAQNVVTGCACMFNKELLQTLDITKLDPEKIVMHDYALAETAALCGRLSYVKTPLVRYRQHESNTIGATKYSVGRWVSRNRENEIGIKASVQQARLILEICSGTKGRREELEFRAYANLLNHGRLSRVFALFRFGFWKSTIARRLGQIYYLLKLPKK